METPPGRSRTTGTTETTSIAWTELSSIRTIVQISKRFGICKRSQTTETIGTIEGYPETGITFIPYQ